MKLAILETGVPPAGMDPAFGTYGDMFRAMLGPLLPGLETVDHDVTAAPLPTAEEADAFLVTGSAAGVYEAHDWIAPLEALVRDIVAAGKPLVGICFGHQLMAQAFGGRVEKVRHGWGVGLHTYEIVERAPFMGPAVPPRITCAVSHQDQVVEPPAGAVRHGGSAFCPWGILSYVQGPALSFQMHPEFTHDFARALLERRADSIPAGVKHLALPGLAHPSDRGMIAEWIAAFLTSVPGLACVPGQGA